MKNKYSCLKQYLAKYAINQFGEKNKLKYLKNFSLIIYKT